ncbi:hypothetical protein KEM54_006621 [Ascosphaera aggregata]|nr:hypothetical protein KEM54_006621 [Ascosphaera aggregata]
MSARSRYPAEGHRGTLNESVESFLQERPDIHLGRADFLAERSHHARVFGLQAIPAAQQAPIGDLEFTAIRGPAGTIPIRVLYPKSGEAARDKGEAAALIYFHGGGYTVGSVDEFENGLRILAEAAGVQIYAADYRLSPEWKWPTQLGEFDAVFHWLQNIGGPPRGVHPDRICGGGDSVGGNMAASVSIRRKDEGNTPLKAQFLYYPVPRIPFDTKASVENNSGYYVECNGYFAFADHYLPQGVTITHPYVSPGAAPPERLRGLPPTAVYTCGFDPLRDVGIDFARRLDEAGNDVTWRHYDDLTHGFLQFAPWSRGCLKALQESADDIRKLAYE